MTKNLQLAIIEAMNDHMCAEKGFEMYKALKESKVKLYELNKLEGLLGPIG